jgi:hypothetical protein
MSQRVYIVSQQLIANNIELISARCWQGYQDEGRGVILIDGSMLDGAEVPADPMTYLSEKKVTETGEGWPSENVAYVVEKYVPESEVIVVVKWRGHVGVYRLKSPTPPPTAYSRMKDVLTGKTAYRPNITLFDS